MSMTVRCAVLGSPIDHSLSPALHRAAYTELGLADWEYERHQVTEDRLAPFIAGLDRSWRGLSLTMPLKQVALDLGAPDELSVLAGAANTMIFGSDADGPATARVHNTDVGGLQAAFAAAGISGIGTATVLGAGATARSALISVARMGGNRVHLLARRPGHAEQTLGPLAQQLNLELRVRDWSPTVPTADVLISTVVKGATDPIAEPAAAAAPVIFDVIYDPWPTPLAQAADRAGRTVLNGLDLLVHQAIGQLHLMTGHTVPAQVLYAAAHEELTRR